jgi:hypothetical protein
MSEWGLVWSFPLKLIPTVLFALCYMWGGRTQKWVRRYLGPVLFTLSCAILAQVFGSISLKISVLLLFIPVLTMPYSMAPGNYKRVLYVLALTGIALLCAVLFGPLGYLQAILSFSTGMFFCINHPISAVNEEGIIALLSTVLIPFMLI